MPELVRALDVFLLLFFFDFMSFSLFVNYGAKVN